MNAVLDALAPLSIRGLDIPLRPEKIWQAIQAAWAGKQDQADPVLPAALADNIDGRGETSKTYVFQ